MGVKGDFKFPSKSIPVTTRYLDKIPRKEELRQILSAPKLDISTKIVIHLMAYSGMRPEDICSLTYSCIREDFEKGLSLQQYGFHRGKQPKPMLPSSQQKPSKLLKQYFKQREDAGEKITEESPLLIDWMELRKTGKVKRIQRKNLCTRITRALRKSGIKLEEKLGSGIIRKTRPYSLRKYFRSNLTGHMPSEYIEALMGHISGLQHTSNLFCYNFGITFNTENAPSPTGPHTCISFLPPCCNC